ncbi:MAG: hypothetical protein QXQ60_06650 [Thermofilum sp.]
MTKMEWDPVHMVNDALAALDKEIDQFRKRKELERTAFELKSALSSISNHIRVADHPEKGCIELKLYGGLIASENAKRVLDKFTNLFGKTYEQAALVFFVGQDPDTPTHEIPLNPLSQYVDVMRIGVEYVRRDGALYARKFLFSVNDVKCYVYVYLASLE